MDEAAIRALIDAVLEWADAEDDFNDEHNHGRRFQIAAKRTLDADKRLHELADRLRESRCQPS